VFPRQATVSVLQLGGAAFTRAVPDAIQPSSDNAIGPEIRARTHGTPPQVAPAAMASSSVHVPSQLAGGSNGTLRGAPVLHGDELAEKCCGGPHVPEEGEHVQGEHDAGGGMTGSACPWYATTGASTGHWGAVPAGPIQSSPGPCQS
jgi:hypothetical protein